MSNREISKRKRYQDILSTAVSLFRQYGTGNVSIDKIAGDLHVGKGTVYNYFQSKDEIYTHIVIAFYHDLIRQLEQIDSTLPIVARLRDLIKIYISFHLRDLEQTRLVFSCRDIINWQNLQNESLLAWQQYLASRHNLAADILRQGIAENIVISEDVSRLTTVGISMMEGVVKNLIQGNEKTSGDDLQKLTQLAEDILIKGLRV